MMLTEIGKGFPLSWSHYVRLLSVEKTLAAELERTRKLLESRSDHASESGQKE